MCTVWLHAFPTNISRVRVVLFAFTCCFWSFTACTYFSMRVSVACDCCPGESRLRNRRKQPPWKHLLSATSRRWWIVRKSTPRSFDCSININVKTWMKNFYDEWRSAACNMTRVESIDQVLVTMSNDVVAHCAWFSTQFLALIHVLVIVNASQTHKAICWKRLLTWMTSTLRASASLYTSVRHRRLEWNLLIIHLMKAYRSYTTARLLSISIPDATASAERECRQWEQKKKHFREFDF